MADPYVRQARGVFSATIGSTSVTAGDLLYWDGTDWERADADVHTTFAEAIAVNTYNSGDVGNLCTSCIVVDLDAPFTQGDQYYLAAPTGTPVAGNFTATRPTTAGNLRQLVGFGLSTSELRLEVHIPKEHHVCYNFTSTTAAESGTIIDGTGDMISAFADANAELLGATFAIPQNAVALEFASLFTGAEDICPAADYDVTVSAAADGEQHDAGTQDTTLANLVVIGSAEDEIKRNTMTTGFDAAGLFQPDNVVGVKITTDGCQNGIILVLTLEMVYLVV